MSNFISWVDDQWPPKFQQVACVSSGGNAAEDNVVEEKEAMLSE